MTILAMRQSDVSIPLALPSFRFAVLQPHGTPPGVPLERGEFRA